MGGRDVENGMIGNVRWNEVELRRNDEAGMTAPSGKSLRFVW